MDLSVVIPLYNEEENVNELHIKLTETLNKLSIAYEIIYVDDGSIDNTLKLLEEIQKNDIHVVVLSFRRNFGQTAAFAAGFDFARGDIVITMDGDLQNDPADIPKLLDAIKDADLVSGWRKKRKDSFLSRKFPSIIANWLIGKVTGVKLHDYGCSLKAYRKEVIKNLRLYGEMHRFIPALASWYGVKIKEIEVIHHPRRYGTSKYGIGRTIKVLLDLVNVKFLHSFSTKPIQFFGPIGALLMVLGVIIIGYLVWLKFSEGVMIGRRPLLLGGFFSVLIGLNFIGMGFLGEMIVRVYHETQKKPIYILKKILGPGD
ncbi:glycosyltransferase family 2 protein [Thermodesulfovibrio thiophilus]|uniref:glycosyltransferase family 2 protein n=1 Tax=Thermodesulfovibrio thiophilus TaxID=340095 RepID=UPI0003F86015|nr:glycosyltransferase family 2 protein [Thermodesulfovibrio thiophilus]